MNRIAKALIVCSGLGIAAALPAQTLAVKVGGGFTSPVGSTSPRLDTGWNFSLGAGAHINRWFDALGDFTYNRFGITRAALNALNEPDGNVQVWSITAQPAVHLTPSSRVDPYITGGAGIYIRKVEFTAPTFATVTVFDPFFGFFFPAIVPADVILGSNTVAKFGLNIGGGLAFRIGAGRTKVFVEARYDHMYTSPIATEYVPVTFGLSW